MRHLYRLLFLTFLGACNEEKPSIDGSALALEVCNCTEKANAMKGTDPNRAAEMKKCDVLQKSTWNTVKGTDQQDAYNARFPCGR